MKKNIFIILFLIGLAIFFVCPFVLSQKKDFVYKKSPYSQNNHFNSLSNINAKSFVDLTKYLPVGFVKDGSIDYTTVIQKGIDDNKNVKMPNFPLFVNEKGLNLHTGARILFQKNSSLIMKPNSLENYGIIRITDIEDVVIYSPTLIGDRTKHIGTKGEWGMGIYILSAKNIQILNPNISNCWGDGIYIGSGKQGSSKNITINNGIIDFNRRNGISITDGDSIQVVNTIISNTNGTAPMCGIDIEPNDNKATIDNIHIINPITFNNSNAGILIHLNSFLGLVQKKVGIRIDNHKDYSSDIGFMFGNIDDKKTSFQPLSGSIDIVSPEWRDNRNPIYFGKNNLAPNVNFKNIKIENSKEDIQKIKLDLSKKVNVFVK